MDYRAMRDDEIRSMREHAYLSRFTLVCPECHEAFSSRSGKMVRHGPKGKCPGVGQPPVKGVYDSNLYPKHRLVSDEEWPWK